MEGSEKLAWNVSRLLWLVPISGGVGILSGWKPIVLLALSFMMSSRKGKKQMRVKAEIQRCH